LWTFDRLPRRLLPEKCTGVFPQIVDHAHPLMAGVQALVLPHSRFNEISSKDLRRVGYRVLAQSAGDGWTIATGERGQCQVLLMQGHPEYNQLTLLREYRRDVRRYLSGEQGSYPQIPFGYVDGEGTAALEAFRDEVLGKPRDAALLAGLPFEFAAARLSPAWDVPAKVFMGNWLRSVQHMTTARAGAGLVGVGPPGATVSLSSTAAEPLAATANEPVALQ
jgi:homoserine O-succinyltransferase